MYSANVIIKCVARKYFDVIRIAFGCCIVQVQHYPTLILYYGNNRIHEYLGKRDVDSMRELVFDIVRKHNEL